MYREADTSFAVNFESRDLKPIRISLPSPPPVDTIDGWGMHPDQQIFKKLEQPPRLKEFEAKILRRFSDKNRGISGNNILAAYWAELDEKSEYYKEEITFIKKFIWYQNYGYWCFIDGKPTYIPPWYFNYLNLHRMTTEKGYEFPEFRDKGRLRFLFRHYISNTTETFADVDKEGIAFKVPDENGYMVYRMADTHNRLFVGTIEPKDRRGGLTNETCSIILSICTSQRGADKLGTIVSMGGDNAETHFRKKLIPAWNSWPLFARPVWIGGFGKFKQLEFTANGLCGVDTLDTMVNFTDSGDDLANDGKMLIAADYDEQGKGKRTGNVQNRWQINKETMSLGGGSHFIGFCVHPSTVEKMSEGGQDYKDMCDLSNFYQRKKDGQTITGLALCYMPSSYCLEKYIGYFGEAIREYPTDRQIRLGFKRRIGSSVYIRNKRKDLYQPDDPKKMDEFRSFVRKFPEDYNECWTGVAGVLGFDNEKIRERLLQLLNKPETKRGEFVWLDKSRWIAGFQERPDGKWVIAKELPRVEANQITTMMDYSAFEDDEVVVNRPVNASRFMMGVDSQQFSNKAESQYLSAKHTKKSDTAITVLQRRDPKIDISDNPKDWVTRKFIAAMRARLSSSIEAAEEALKAAVYYGCLMHIETNRTEIWERIVEWRFGGYLNYNVEVLADGTLRKSAKPGTSLAANSKKTGFSLMADYINYHAHLEPIKELLEEADQISSLEQLTIMDLLASAIEALIGDQSMYPDLMTTKFEDDEKVDSLGLIPMYV
jgi:hypothetical protein